MTGIAQFLAKNNLETLKEWSNVGYKHIKDYDKILSKSLKIPESIKITSIKPSGTVSLLAGATPGIHFPHSRFYIRRVRLAKDSKLIQVLKDLGYHLEEDVMQPNTNVIVSFPIDIGQNVKTLKDTNLWEQLLITTFMQNHWADNQVSCTISFKNSTEGHLLSTAINYFQYQLKSISFLPINDDAHPYPQMPYEEINEEMYDSMMKMIKISEIQGNYNKLTFQNQESKFCDTDSCSHI